MAHHGDQKIRYVRAASGAVWKSFEVTPLSKIREAQREFMSGYQLPSTPGHELINAAEEIVDDWTKKCVVFEKVKWKGFARKV